MNRQAWLALAAIFATGTGAAFAAQGPGRGPGGDRPPPMGMMMDGGAGPMMGMANPRMLDRMAGQLGLSEDQKQKIKGVFESARPEMEQVRMLARQNADKLRAATPGDAKYDAVVAEVARSAGELATRAVTNGAAVRAEVWAVLTPEQRTRLETLQSERRERMKQRRDERRARMAPPAP